MTFKCITATIGLGKLEDVESSLREFGVPGVTLSETKGYGAYKNFFQRDLLTTHARIRVFVPETKVAEIVQAIMEAAHTGIDDDGVVVVSPVEAMFRISDKSELKPEHY